MHVSSSRWLANQDRAMVYRSVKHSLKQFIAKHQTVDWPCIPLKGQQDACGNVLYYISQYKCCKPLSNCESILIIPEVQ